MRRAACPADELARGRQLFDSMRTQLMGGQFLDLLESARGWDGLDLDARIASARKVIRFKSAKYTIEHPLLIGALVGGAPDGSLAPLSDYGLALGEAFQLRDDLLGVFGDPEATGKPAGDDLREGKRTVLVAHALDAASDTDREIGREPPRTRRPRARWRRGDPPGARRHRCRRPGREPHHRPGRRRLPPRSTGPATTGAYDASALDVLEALVAVSTARRS